MISRRNIISKLVKILGDIYFVYEDNQILECSCLKTIKKDRLAVGDDVEIIPNEYSKDKYIITQVHTRKNIIPRPLVANIDRLVILISPRPQPDFLLVDKLLIYCKVAGIEPVIVINKCDIASEEFKTNIHSQYLDVQIFEVSAKEKTGIDKIRKYLQGSLSAVCGQSAVGKTSFINALFPSLDLKTQDLSKKIDRGKHTTRVNQIFVFEDLMIADTPGFSNLDVNIDYRDLSRYYSEFEPFLDDCKYLDCSHIKEGKDCGVCKALDAGKINKERYLRYVELYQKLKEVWEKKYD